MTDLPIDKALFAAIALFVLGCVMELFLDLPMATEAILTCVQLIVAGILAGLGLKFHVTHRSVKVEPE